MTLFQYSEKIIQNYPNLVGGVIVADNLSFPSMSQALRTAYVDEQKVVKARIGDQPLSELSSLAAWRKAFSAFGVSPTQYRNAAESLLRRLTKKGDLPSINTLVDIGNLISIRYALPVAVFDTKQIKPPITVQYATGDETFATLGGGQIEHPEAGEVIFVDTKKMAIARRWCWRQSATSASNEETTHAIITIEAHHEGGEADIRQAVVDLIELLQHYCQATCDYAILSSDRTAF
ncbi:MAG: phenylalanine--tRNA ligase beta subunit-related protein [Chloroflexota bacterium]